MKIAIVVFAWVACAAPITKLSPAIVEAEPQQRCRDTCALDSRGALVAVTSNSVYYWDPRDGRTLIILGFDSRMQTLPTAKRLHGLVWDGDDFYACAASDEPRRWDLVRLSIVDGNSRIEPLGARITTTSCKLYVDDNHVYAIEGGITPDGDVANRNLARVRKTGGPLEVVVRRGLLPGMRVQIADDAVYFGNESDAIYKWDKQTGVFATFYRYPSQEEPSCIRSFVVDQDNVYWMSYCGETPGIVRVPKVAPRAPELLAAVDNTYYLRHAGRYLYWPDMDSGKKILRVSVDGGALEAIDTPAFIPGSLHIAEDLVLYTSDDGGQRLATSLSNFQLLPRP